MAKINHSNYLDVVQDIVSNAKQRGLMHISSEEEFFNGNEFTIRGNQLKNFATCGYLGLEMHPALIEGSIDLTRRFGTQFSMSRTYIRPPYIKELEDLISQIFLGNKAICYTSTSTAHISVMNSIINPEDLIVLDQQVHFSVQYPAKALRNQGTQVKMVRHSNYNMIEEILINEANNYEKIWYMADGVYSMHGDFPDTDILLELMNKYPKLHLYFDDAHGMSWEGKNGAGYVFERLGVSERIVLISTLAKGFGCVGGTAIFADEKMYKKVDIFGGPLTYSHPLTPATVGAAIASAKIHLSDEIYTYQNELKELITYTNEQLSKFNLTNISSPNSPIYYIGAGNSKVTLNLVNRMINDGFYMNPATFPAVPNDKTGLRFTINRHRNKEDIKSFIERLDYNLYQAVEEEGENILDVYNTFNIPFLLKNKEDYEKENKTSENLIVEEFETINDIDEKLWNDALKDRGNITHSGLKCMEEIFQGNDEKENNWTFHYLTIKDKNGKLILATFFTGTYIKDDMLSLENISRKIEEERKENPYYLCSKTLVMGSMFSDGNFLYLDEKSDKWKDAVEIMLNFAQTKKTLLSAETLLFRDFEEDNVMCKILSDEGFAKITMPNTLRVNNPKWETIDELMALIPSKKKRNNIKQYAIRHLDLFEIEYKNTLTDEEADHFFELFCNVKDANFAFNFFKFPKKITRILSKYAEWEFIDIKLKSENKTIACLWSFIGDNHYSPLFMGLDYNYLNSHHIYKQAVFQMVKRGNDLNKKINYLGFSAEFEKTKYLAEVIPTFAFIKVDETYNIELIESYSNN